MCPRAKTKSKTSSKKSKKQDCPECMARKITREEISQMYMPPMPIPMPMMNQSQPGLSYRHGYGYSYGDWPAWEDNYPAMISRGQWNDHTQIAKNAYNSSQENGKSINEVKSAITSEIKEAHKAIKETQASTDSRVKETRESINLAQTSINNTHNAVKEAYAAIQTTQGIINDKHAEHMSKQEACAADVARVRQILEEETRKREETRRMEEMVRYAQSQGLLQTQGQAQTDRDCDHGSSPSQSSGSTTSSTGGLTAEERKIEKRRQQWERRERERLEHQHRTYQKTMREMNETRLRLRLLEEQERWSRAEGELEFLRRKDSCFHHSRLDDVMEGSPYHAYPYGGGLSHARCGNYP